MEQDWENLRNGIMGFGENNTHKIYYPELKKKLDELNRFKVLMDNVSDMIIQYDISEKRIIDVNRSACKRLAYSKSELIGSKVEEIISDRLFNLIDNYIPTHSDKNLNESVVTLFRTKSGEIFPVELTYQIEQFDGHDYAVLMGRDIENRLKSEKLLIDSENNLRGIFNNIYDAIFIVNEKGIILEINEKATSEFGIEREFAIGNHIKIFSNYEPASEIDELIKKVIAGEEFSFERSGLRPVDSAPYDIEVTLKKINWYGIESIIFSARNITERKFAERELNKNRAILKTAIDRLPFDFWIVDPNEVVLFQNLSSRSHWSDFTGLTQNEIVQNYPELSPMRDKNRRALSGELIEGERTIHINNRYMHVYEIISPVKLDDEIIGAFGTHFDLTERKAAEVALKKSEARLHFALDAVNDAIWDWLPKESELFCSSNFFDVLGYDRSEFTPNGEFWLSLIHDDDIVNFKEKFKDCLGKNNAILNTEARFKMKSGDYKWLLIRGRVIERDDAGEAIRVIGTQTDLTRRKELELELVRLNKDLENRVKDRTAQLEDALEELRHEIEVKKEVEESLIATQEHLEIALEKEKELNLIKSRFISMISHEYRTPLTVIQSSTYLLQRFHELGDDAKFQNSMAMVESSLKTMIKLMEDVLTIGKSHEKEKQINLQSIEFVNFIENIIEEIKIVDKKQHKIELITKENEIIKRTDYSLSLKIIHNLLSNAVKFSPDNSTINVSLERIGQNNIRIAIEDSGIGIPENEINNLFEPFHRFSNAGEIQGTGLGLTIVKNSLDVLGGTINFKSELNVGTVFIVEY